MGDSSNSRVNGESANPPSNTSSLHDGAAYDRGASEPRRPVDLAHRLSEASVQSRGPLVHDLQQRVDSVGFTAEEEYAQILGWCNYDKTAADFLTILFKLSHRADDIVDGDAKSLLAAIVMMISDSTIVLGNNKFWQINHGVLTPVMLCSLMNWYISAKWEKGTKDRQLFAFVLRESLDQIIYLVAFLTGGIEHAIAVAENMMEFYHIKHGEDFDTWRQE